MDAEQYIEGAVGEKILLQGVVDCALLETDGITVLDFKTDSVSAESLPERAAYYCPQVRAYADALTRIYEMPVKKALLYFFELEQFVEL